MKNKIEIYQSPDGQAQIAVQFDKTTVWLNRNQLAHLFKRDVKTIGKHISNVFKEGELEKDSVVANFATTATDGKTYQVEHYNLDVTISVGYRVKSQHGTQFRIWATQRLKDYLVQGYAINKQRLEEKQQEVQHLKNGIRIFSRAIENKAMEADHEWLGLYAKGLQLLDDYDHENLDSKGDSGASVIYPSYEDYIRLVAQMRAEFNSTIFGQERDDGFKSAIGQIRQSFGEQELYPTFEEKAAMLLYLITKNHAFVDGNKRIAAACFLLFLQQNQCLYSTQHTLMVSNEALASLTLFIAASKSEEMDTVKHLIVSILNRNREA